MAFSLDSMPLWRGSIDPGVPAFYLSIFAITAFAFLSLVFSVLCHPKIPLNCGSIAVYTRFFYASFLKPHTGDGADTGQQAALESFYKAQVCWIISPWIFVLRL